MSSAMDADEEARPTGAGQVAPASLPPAGATDLDDLLAAATSLLNIDDDDPAGILKDTGVSLLAAASEAAFEAEHNRVSGQANSLHARLEAAERDFDDGPLVSGLSLSRGEIPTELTAEGDMQAQTEEEDSPEQAKLSAEEKAAALRARIAEVFSATKEEAEEDLEALRAAFGGEIPKPQPREP